MKVLNFGSLNIDYVYEVSDIVAPGETIKAFSRSVFVGGKGLNQSVAMARAGVDVVHAGCIGEEGDILLRTLEQENIDTSFIRIAEGQGGHTIIQVDKNGQNSIIVFGGANHKITKEHIDTVFQEFTGDDLLVLQNEINNLSYIMEKAASIGMKIVLNPSPYNDDIGRLPLAMVSYFVVNEIEGMELFRADSIEEIMPAALSKYPGAKIVLTLGENGAWYSGGGDSIFQPVFSVKALDTTAAGDCFLGYFVQGLAEGLPVEQTLKNAAFASAISVSRKGAAPSIPRMEELADMI